MSDLRVDVVDAHDAVVSESHATSEDVATIPSFGLSAAPEVRSQEEATVVEPSPVSPKKKATGPPSKHQKRGAAVTRVNSTNVLDEGLRIGEVGHRMNLKVNQSNKVCIKSKHGK
jgi:hypothetical protein